MHLSVFKWPLLFESSDGPVFNKVDNNQKLLSRQDLTYRTSVFVLIHSAHNNTARSLCPAAFNHTQRMQHAAGTVILGPLKTHAAGRHAAEPKTLRVH